MLITPPAHLRVAVVLLAIAGAALAQFSPGQLSKAHRTLRGATQCTSCHALAGGGRNFRCLECHHEIRQRLASNRGLHPRLAKNLQKDQAECKRCHSEHQGEQFVPIRWDVDIREFDHARTGYVLEGAHRKLECRKCHTAEHISGAERRRIAVKDLNRTWLGLSPQCVSCHKDEHRGQVGADCARCHTPAKWKPAERFNHALAHYRLEGAHEKVPCAKCHIKPDGYNAVQYSKLSFAGCAGCHNDPHRKAFRPACETCHATAGWKEAARSVASHFEHNRYPLEGKHAALSCGKCHKTADYTQKVAHTRCLDCHSPDAHGGQFRADAAGAECSRCHVVNGWKPTTFNVAQHASSRYALEGLHAKVPCAKCHKPAGENTEYHVAFDPCTACHEDTHKAQFAGSPQDNRCQECHTSGGFRPSTFQLAQHARTRFALNGAHRAIPCAECHRSRTLHDTAGRFRFEDRSCRGCHEDPHENQFNARIVGQAVSPVQDRLKPVPPGCEACHNDTNWHDLSKFDHATTKFTLVGAHRGVACGDCHKPTDKARGIRSVAFRAAPVDCGGCHKDPHDAQFAAAGPANDCRRCHEILKWNLTRFSHDRSAGFALSGAHRGVPCIECHRTTRMVNEKLTIVYKPTPRECSGCHGPTTIAN